MITSDRTGMSAADGLRAAVADGGVRVRMLA
jgi:hypothetical protein